MVVRCLIQEWIAQWLGLRDRLRAAPVDQDTWWLGIRERILRFMVSRYIDEHPEDLGHAENTEAARAELHALDRPPHPPLPPPIPLEARRTYCRVTAEHHPPRTCVDMQGKLRSVSRINEDKRPRWRWL